MGRFNQRGEYLTGVAGGPLAIDRRVIGAGSGRWLDDDTVLANATLGQDIYHLYRFDRATGWAPQLVDTRGATSVGAGHGNWAATLASHPFETYGGWRGAMLPTQAVAAHVLDGGQDGTLLFASDDYLSIVALWPDGASDVFPVDHDTRFDLTRAIDGGLVYVSQPGMTLYLQLRGQPRVAIQTVETPFEPYSVVVDGERWFLYHNNRTVVHTAGASVGHVFPPGYHPDLCVVSGRQGRLGMATNEEAPDAIVLKEFEFGQGMVSLATSPPPVAVPSLTVTHPILVTVFKDPDGHSGAPAEIVVNQTGQTVRRPYFVAEDSLGGPFLGERLGIYSEAADPTAAVALAAAHHTRLLLGHDATSDWMLPAALLRPWDIPAIELYRSPPETLAQSVARWRHQAAALLAAWSHDCGLILQFYGMNYPVELWTVQEVLDGIGAAMEIVNASPRFKVVAPFAFLRANGVTGHPDLAEALARLIAASPALPVLLSVGETPPPPTSPWPMATAFQERGMKVSGKLHGKYVGVDPNVPQTVYADRTSAGGWEHFELTPSQHPKMFIATFGDANRGLSQQPDGSFQTRDAGTDGEYEQFYATNQPDGSALLYRFQDGALVVPVLQLEKA